jgi:chitodextrinase
VAWRATRNSMLVRRRPSAATLVAIVVTLVIGTQTGLAAGSSQSGRGAPDPVRSVEVTATDGSSVTIAWPPSRDRDVVGYTVYANGARVGTLAADQLRRWRDRETLLYTVRDLACGTGYTVGVDAFDRDDRHSSVTSTTVSTSACPDATPPSAPSGVRQVAATETSVVLAWTPSSDNVGVVEYGLYVGALRVSTVSDTNATLTSLKCGTGYLIAIDAADAAGNRSAQASSFFRTSDCPSTNQPPTTPTGLRVTAATATSVSLAWTASTDDVAVAGYGLYVAGQRTGQTTTTSATSTGLQCGTTYALGVDAYDNTGKRSTVAELSTATFPCAPPPPSSTGAVTQTITNGATLSGTVGWRAVFDANGDGVGDDPGSIAFYVDGTQVLSEINPPFGDTAGFWASTSVSDGQHTFQVRALNDAGTVLATNTITASVHNQTSPPPPPPPPPPPSSTGAVTQTITNGATLSGTVGWRAVFDANGDGVGDDPGSIAFYVDGTQVLSEINPPFGDTAGFWASTSVSDGQHTFQVRALSDSGTVLASQSVSASVSNTTAPAADTTPPSTPSNLRVTSATATSVTVAWSVSTDNVGVTGYDLYRATTKVGSTTTATTYTINSLTCGTAYSVGVRALDAAGNTSSQATMSATTSACADTQPPTAPTNVTASTRTTTSIALTWAPSTDNIGVAGYGIYNGADLVQTTTGTAGIVSGLTCNTNYTLAVDAFDPSGNSSTKTTVMLATLPCADTTPPTQPTNLRLVSATTTSVTLAWNASTDNVGVAGYDIYRATTKIGSATTTNYTINGLSCGTTYSVGVSALDAAGNTSTRATTSIATSACTPPPPPSGCALPAYPDASCTGVPAGTTLTPRQGPITITTPGAVLQNLDITYTGSDSAVSVNAQNVTIRNVRIRSNGISLIQVNTGGSLLIEDSELINRPVAGQPNCHNGIATGNYTARRLEITGCENGAEMFRGNVVFEDNYVHDLDTVGPSYYFGNAAPHADGVQLNGGASNIVIRHNTIDPIPSGHTGGTSGIIGNTSGDNVRIEDNTIDGGGSSYAVYAPRTSKTAWFMNRNKFGRGAYGYTACVRLGITVTEFNQNTDFNSGAAVNPDNGVGGGCTN